MFKAEIAEFKKLPKTASDPHDRKTPQVAEIWLKPNSITLASSELAPNMFEAGSCQIQLH